MEFELTYNYVADQQVSQTPGGVGMSSWCNG